MSLWQQFSAASLEDRFPPPRTASLDCEMAFLDLKMASLDPKIASHDLKMTLLQFNTSLRQMKTSFLRLHRSLLHVNCPFLRLRVSFLARNSHSLQRSGHFFTRTAHFSKKVPISWNAGVISPLSRLISPEHLSFPAIQVRAAKEGSHPQPRHSLAHTLSGGVPSRVRFSTSFRPQNRRDCARTD